jgi:flagellar hook-associated protein FlgK
LDEEVAHLILMQQAYTASARIITTARENITTLLELVR